MEGNLEAASSDESSDHYYDFTVPYDGVKETLIRLKEADRICKNMLILMDYRNFWQVDKLFHNKKIGEIIWEYGWVSGGRSKAKYGFFPTHNTIGLYGNKESFKFIKGSIIKRDKGLSSPRQCSFANKTGHPYEKPTKLIEVLIDNLNNCTLLALKPYNSTTPNLSSAVSISGS